MTIPDVLPHYDEMPDAQKIGLLGIAITDVRVKVDNHDKILIKGTPPELPLIERVRNLETFRNDFQFWFRILIGALIAQTVAFGYGIFVAIVKFLPVLERLSQTQKP